MNYSCYICTNKGRETNPFKHLKANTMKNKKLILEILVLLLGVACLISFIFLAQAKDNNQFFLSFFSMAITALIGIIFLNIVTPKY